VNRSRKLDLCQSANHMLQTEFFYSMPIWLISCGLLVLLLLAIEAGVRAGARARARRNGQGTADLGAIQGAVLGLLGLLLAFTYSLAAGRQDARRGLVVREANTIGTAYLRAGLLPEPRRAELRAILRQYADSRIAPDDVVRDPVKLAEAVRRSEQVLQTLWPAASRNIEGRPPTVLDSLMFQALNEVIDLHTERLAAFEYRIPQIILWLLFAVATMAMAMTGFGGGLSGRRSLFLTSTLAVLVAAVIMVILDLDHPRRGFIRASQRTMIQLRDSLQADADPTPKPHADDTRQSR
jgi:hypothetical protein